MFKDVSLPSILVSVIIPAYGRTDLLRKAVRSAIDQDLEKNRFEVIVVDSSKDSRNVEMIAELQKESRCELRCFRKDPEGPGPSRNLGANEARGKYFAFLDSDCQASPEWLREGLSNFEEGVGIVQGRTIPEQGVPHSVFHRSLEVYQESCFYETANIFYDRKAFEQAGGFLADEKGSSEKWVVGGEDVDLAWKVKRAGWKSRFSEKALVMHALVRIPVWRWFFETRMSTVPLVIRGYPELRQFFYARYFFDQTQALLVLGLTGLFLGFLSPWALILTLPYIFKRASEPSQTLRGPFRLLRAVLYFPRDMATFGALVAGSIRYGALLL
jgi:glycosyltransferase involved in cell wall biosynthesis